MPADAADRLLTGRARGAATLVPPGLLGGRLYIAGGRPGALTALESFDPAAGSWSSLPSLPSGRSSSAGAGIDGQFLVPGRRERYRDNRDRPRRRLRPHKPNLVQDRGPTGEPARRRRCRRRRHRLPPRRRPQRRRLETKRYAAAPALNARRLQHAPPASPDCPATVIRSARHLVIACYRRARGGTGRAGATGTTRAACPARAPDQAAAGPVNTFASGSAARTGRLPAAGGPVPMPSSGGLG